MFAEHSTTTILRFDGFPDLELHLAVRITIPTDAEYNVSTALLYAPQVPERLQDVLHPALYNAVHAGLQITNFDISHGIDVEVITLKFSWDAAALSREDLMRLSHAFYAIMRGAIVALCGSLPANEGDS